MRPLVHEQLRVAGGTDRHKPCQRCSMSGLPACHCQQKEKIAKCCSAILPSRQQNRFWQINAECIRIHREKAAL